MPGFRRGAAVLRAVVLVALGLSGLLLAACAHGTTAAVGERSFAVIVQAGDLEAARSAVLAVGGEITHELGIIRAVGAVLTSRQITEIRLLEGVKVHENRPVTLGSDRVGCAPVPNGHGAE